MLPAQRHKSRQTPLLQQLCMPGLHCARSSNTRNLQRQPAWVQTHIIRNDCPACTTVAKVDAILQYNRQAGKGYTSLFFLLQLPICRVQEATFPLRFVQSLILPSPFHRSTIPGLLHPPLTWFVPAAPPLFPAVNPNHTLKAGTTCC